MESYVYQVLETNEDIDNVMLCICSSLEKSIAMVHNFCTSIELECETPLYYHSLNDNTTQSTVCKEYIIT